MGEDYDLKLGTGELGDFFLVVTPCVSLWLWFGDWEFREDP